jgi:hypothetical protein
MWSTVGRIGSSGRRVGRIHCWQMPHFQPSRQIKAFK